MLVVSFLCCVYYNVIIAWCLYYMFKSFASVVPWASCGNLWNTPNCSLSSKSNGAKTNNVTTSANRTAWMNSTSCLNQTLSDFTIGDTAFHNSTSLTPGTLVSCVNSTVNNTVNSTTAPMTHVAAVGGDSPSKEFWERYVLEITPNMDELGSFRVELLVALIVAWILVYFCLWKGIKSSGKVVYFTATFPYVVLVILLIRGVTLPGASKGIKFYLEPDWKKLADAKVWAAAATQIFYSLGIGFGSLITMGSFNQFHNNCFR